MSAEQFARPTPGTWVVELRIAHDGSPVAVMSPADFRRIYGGQPPEGMVDEWSVIGLDGRRVDVGSGAQLRHLTELRLEDAAAPGRAKAGRSW